jgi:K+-sensing histidine kinase KdpD
MLDDVPAGVATLGVDLRIRSANRRLGEIVGVAAGDLVGRPFEQLLTLPARLLFQTHVYPTLLAERRVEEVFLWLGESGERAVPVLLNAEALDGPDGGYAIAIVRIRARSKWEEDLLAATRALEQEQVASQKLADDLAATARDLDLRQADEKRTRAFRDAFVGVVSHELRTPITTIFGMSHLLRERHTTMDPDAVTDALEDIEAEADRLRRLTEDLLVLSRAEGGRLEATSDPLLLGHLLRSAVRQEASRAEGHRFEVEIEPDLPLVLGESTYVEQVLRNYLSNAVKYSPAGTLIRVEARSEAEGAAVRVTDEGRGLGDEPSDDLWALFYRTEDAVRQASGAGIGLFVSKELIEAMGGRVWAAPAATGGAEFGFWLPAVTVLDEG